MDIFLYIENTIVITQILLCFYQVYFVFVAITREIKKSTEKRHLKYAILIAAKNEEDVIKDLLVSINKQNYERELITTFVVCNNCTDSTEMIAKQNNAITYVYNENNNHRTNLSIKAYAMKYLLKKIDDDFGFDTFDGYIVFDADNVLDENYVSEINNVINGDAKIVEGYRAPKNFDDTWVSAANGIWFIRESAHINKARNILGLNSIVSGTGFAIHKDIIKSNGGWKHFLMTEDLDFSIDSILKNEKISFCPSALFFDEQPTCLRDSLNQRFRWSKGFFQVAIKYSRDLFDKLIKEKKFTYYDLLFTLLIGFIYIYSIIIFWVLQILRLIMFDDINTVYLVINKCINSCICFYLAYFIMSVSVFITEWKNIKKIISKKHFIIKCIFYNFMFPIFVASYIPLGFFATFLNVKWKKIKHSSHKKF